MPNLFVRVAIFLTIFFLPLPALAGLKVVTTVPDLAAIVKEVGGTQVKVTSMALPTQDPHFVDAKPNLALELSQADMLVAVGLDLEVGWLPVLQTGSRNAKIQSGGQGYLNCSQFITPLDVASTPVDRSMGDIHPGGNPHYLYDPRNAIPVARGIAAKMAALDPMYAATYTVQAEDFVARITKDLPGWQSSLAGYKGRSLVTYHKSWEYLAKWLGFSVLDTIEPKPGIPPSPAHVAAVVQTMKSQQILTILQESYYPATTAQQVQQLAGAKLVRIAGGTDFVAGQTFEGRIIAMVDALKTGL